MDPSGLNIIYNNKMTYEEWRDDVLPFLIKKGFTVYAIDTDEVYDKIKMEMLERQSKQKGEKRG